MRFTSPRELRDKYEHRVIVERLIEETPYSVRLLLPWPYEVHHADYDKRRNCPCNFILLSESLHSTMTAAGRARGPHKVFQPKWRDVPAHLGDAEDGLLIDSAPDWVGQP